MRPFCLFLLLIVLACHPYKNKPVTLSEINFSTSDASELFFRNIRKSYYHQEALTGTGMEIYTVKDLTENFFFTPKLVLDWRDDEASLLLDLHDSIEEDQNELLFVSDRQEETFLYEGHTRMQQTELALRLYNAILKNEQVYWLRDSNRVPLFQNEADRECFRKLVFDFLRLTDVR